jgi:hypothetical protein
MATKPKDGDHVDLTRKVESFSIPEPPKTWKPSMTKSFTHEYGSAVGTPSLPVNELAAQYVREMYPHVIEGSDRFKKLVDDTEAAYMDALNATKGM